MREKPKHAPIRVRRVADAKHVRRAGDFYWHTTERGDRYLRMAVPGQRQEHVVTGIKCTGKDSWAWNGDEERPVLKEIVELPYWRGYVRRGFLVEAD